MKDAVRAWEYQTANGKPIRLSWLRKQMTITLLDLLELAAVLETDRSTDGDSVVQPPKYITQSKRRIRAEILSRGAAVGS